MSNAERKTRRAVRLEKKRQLLGPDAKCECQRADVRYLKRVKRSGSQTADILCRNCYKKRSHQCSDQHRHTVSRRFAAKGYPEPQCLGCHESDVCVLELHHVATEANSELVVPLCLNCHAIASDDWEDLSIDLRVRDDERRPLVLQAAFEFGLAVMLWLMAALVPPTARVFLGMAGIVLVAWAVWNLAADQHFASTYGPDYSIGVAAPVPR
jgi:hypothetical protein